VKKRENIATKDVKDFVVINYLKLVKKKFKAKKIQFVIILKFIGFN